MRGVKWCPKCQRLLDVSAFTINRSRRDGLQRVCRDCQREYVRSHYERNLQYYLDKAQRNNRKRYLEVKGILEQLKSVPCTDCGVRYPSWVMDFDHVRGVKLFNVAEGRRSRSSAILAEVAKCEVVCANCHRERTYQRLHARP